MVESAAIPDTVSVNSWKELAAEPCDSREFCSEYRWIRQPHPWLRYAACTVWSASLAAHLLARGLSAK